MGSSSVRSGDGSVGCRGLGARVEAVERGRAMRGAGEALPRVDEGARRLHGSSEVRGVQPRAEHRLVHAAELGHREHLAEQRIQVSADGGGCGEDEPMRFVLEVDLDAGALAGENRAAELGRILRYWGGYMKQMELAPGAQQDLSDSDYAVVGSWRIED